MVNPFCATTKDYKKTLPKTQQKHRIPFMQREKAAILKLRQHGYTIPALSAISGRSASVIHNILKHSWNPNRDLRKMPNKIRLQIAQVQRQRVDFCLKIWMPFILGEVDKPP